jgi:hypothetical protein
LSSCPVPVIVAACDDGDVVTRGGWVRWDRPIWYLLTCAFLGCESQKNRASGYKVHAHPDVDGELVVVKDRCGFLCLRDEVV